MKNTRKPLSTLTLGQKNLSRRVIFMAEEDAVKALIAKNLPRPTSAREMIIVKHEAVKVLKAKEFDRAVLEAQEGMLALASEQLKKDKVLKAKGLAQESWRNTRQSKGGTSSTERDSRKQLRIKQLQATVHKANEQVFGEGVLPNTIAFNKLTSYDVYQLEVLIRNLLS